ncbi:MAG: hypothetical protein IPF44_07915 [Betaproteobacteria bacterium]|nr:hypothetical protein [Betaproteobacteria bacterium]
MKYAEGLIVVMRVYFEKPRTVNWKGLIAIHAWTNTFRISEEACAWP